ncbi:hypothetical protein [Streptomyces lydicamycinicus]|uniref:hypothetical protein n=1 Tax=Streptomyces lydicamycinicus TaxID=1546107 RepID=UPI003C2EC604
MPLDMTGDARHESAVHYRRYLDRNDKVIVICVQDFDYRDYEPHRFVDLAAFNTELEAEMTPLRPDDVVQQTKGLCGDSLAFVQALRLLQAIRGRR